MPRTLRSARYSALRTRLIAERERRSLTQAEVARRLGRPQSYVSKVELGERRLDVIELFDFLKALGAEPLAFIRRL